MKQELIDRIIACEWEMFGHVANAGGRAFCQEDPATFRIMRASQCATWSEDVLRSYLADLKNALEEGRNLLAEKYAWMMAATYPREFERIKDQLPLLDEQTVALIEAIVTIHVRWQQTVDDQYPRYRQKGRPLASADDTCWVTSFETYLRGELKTYSRATLERYYNYTVLCQEQGRNLAAENLNNIVLAYGYPAILKEVFDDESGTSEESTAEIKKEL